MKDILNHFSIYGSFIGYEPTFFDEINSSYIAYFDEKKEKLTKYIVQIIEKKNQEDFEKIMSKNLFIINHLINNSLLNNLNENQSIFTPIQALDKSYYYYDAKEENYYRVYLMQDHIIPLNQLKEPRTSYNLGKFYNQFQTKVTQIKALFHFIDHNEIENLFENFKNSIIEDEINRKTLCQTEIEFFLRNDIYLVNFYRLKKQKKFPYEVVLKPDNLRNFLHNKITGEICVPSNFDRVTRDTILYDFGILANLCSFTYREKKDDVREILFSKEHFKAFCFGFFKNSFRNYTIQEKECFIQSIIVTTFEQGISYLTDYLSGDIKYKSVLPHHNLLRAKEKIQCIEQLISHQDYMDSVLLLALAL